MTQWHQPSPEQNPSGLMHSGNFGKAPSDLGSPSESSLSTSPQAQSLPWGIHPHLENWLPQFQPTGAHVDDACALNQIAQTLQHFKTACPQERYQLPSSPAWCKTALGAIRQMAKKTYMPNQDQLQLHDVIQVQHSETPKVTYFALVRLHTLDDTVSPTTPTRLEGYKCMCTAKVSVTVMAPSSNSYDFAAGPHCERKSVQVDFDPPKKKLYWNFVE